MSLRQIVASSIMGVAAQGMSRLLANLAVGRIGGVDSVGQIGTISAVAFTAALLGPTALGAALSKFVAHAQGREDENAEQAISTGLLTRAALLTAALASGVACWIGLTLGMREVIPALVMTLGACGYAITRPWCFVQRRSSEGVIIEVAAGVLGVVGACGLALLGVTGGWVLVPQGAGLIFYALYFFPRLERRWMPIGREASEFVALGTAAGLASSGVFQGTILFARLDGGVKAAGLAASAFSISTPLSFIASAVTSALYPRLAISVGAGEGVAAQTLAQRASSALASVLCPLFLMISWFAPELMTIVWGREFVPAAVMVPPMVTAILATSMAAPQVALLTAKSRGGVRLSAMTSVGGTVLGVILWAAAYRMPGSQPQLIAWGYLLSMALTAIAAVLLTMGSALSAVVPIVAASTGVLLAPVVRSLLPGPLLEMMAGLIIGVGASVLGAISSRRLLSTW
ncbi:MULTISPECIES: lipopolysaccharide biosynthesis protein [unclassified Luteococcus]|uniref:lipopolysaccharide biosynthesis protein n=1 Tax=unclassified Luteococcus TaxID=2639923 RepID=UPI00313E15E3